MMRRVLLVVKLPGKVGFVVLGDVCINHGICDVIGEQYAHC